jgi:hypothetical protein
MKISVIRDYTSCSLKDSYQRFGGTCCLHLQSSAVRIKYTKTRSEAPRANEPIRVEVLTARNVTSAVFWHVTPCSLVDAYRCLGGMYCLSCQDLGVSQASLFLIAACFFS